MSEQNVEKSGGAGVPQDVADGIAQIAVEVHGFGEAARRGWKVTAISFGVVLAIIALYLKFFVYDFMVTEYSKPEILVSTVLNMVDDALTSAQLPTVDSGQLPDWAIRKLAAQAPSVVHEYLKPQIEAQVKRLPELRHEKESGREH